MRYCDLITSNEPTFKRLTGVSRAIFGKMVEESERFKPASTHKIKGNMRGPKPKLTPQDQVLMLLMYYREYRTFLHIATTFGISEAQCWRIITGLERLLIKSELFHIKGKKRLLSAENIEVVLIDVSESPVEHPKKNSASIIRAKRNVIR
jgi:hypothetical protein